MNNEPKSCEETSEGGMVHVTHRFPVYADGEKCYCGKSELFADDEGALEAVLTVGEEGCE